ncbi:MAG: CRTAC1 family protein, partial [Planctomycetota bacterium]
GKVEETRKYRRPSGQVAEEPGFPEWREAIIAERTNLRYDRMFFGNGLYRNLGGGKFEEVSDRANAETFWPWGIANGDYDQDGFEDALIPSGMGFPFPYWRSPFLKNNGDGTFTDLSGSVGIDPPPGGKFLDVRLGGMDVARSSRCAAVGDFDGDGRLDVVVNNFNDRPFLLMNRWPKRNFIAFRLRGTRGNRDAVGAVVSLHAGGRVMVRQVQAAGGYLAQSSKTVHFGLGDARSVERCEIRWPGGRVQSLGSLEPNRMHAVTEPAE